MTGIEILAPLLTAGAATAGAGATIAAASNKPKLPTPEPIKRMPDPESPEVLEARRQKLAERQAAGGRESTILADDTYSNNLLGQ